MIYSDRQYSRAAMYYSIAVMLCWQLPFAYSHPLLHTMLPTPDHVVVVIMENHGYSEIIGSAAAPYINILSKDSYAALFSQSYAIEHPSQPNYLDLFAGCNQGITDDGFPSGQPFTSNNLARELIDAGRTFATYSEDLPSVGFNGATSGNYARKHNPAANWMGAGMNQIPANTNQPLTAFPSNYDLLPTVCYVVPNLNNDMHNGTNPGTITTGDQWVKNHLDSYIQWAKTHNSLLILTFDEDDNSAANQIATIFLGEMVLQGNYPETIDHYSLLRTIEDMYGLPYACNAANADPITDIWTGVSGVSSGHSLAISNVFTCHPNPSSRIVTIDIDKSMAGKLQTLEVRNDLGISVYNRNIANSTTIEYQIRSLPPGNYFVRVSDGKSYSIQKMVVQ